MLLVAFLLPQWVCYVCVVVMPYPFGLNQYWLLHREMPAEAPLHDAHPPTHTSITSWAV